MTKKITEGIENDRCFVFKQLASISKDMPNLW